MTHTHLLLSVGTQVVSLVEVKGTDGRPAHPQGAVGVVVQAPADYWHCYRVRFPDGLEAALKRQELSVLADYKRGDMGTGSAGALAEYDLYDFVIYRCVVGSRAYGLDDADSDTDRRGTYLPPAAMHWSLYGVPEQLENPATEEKLAGPERSTLDDADFSFHRAEYERLVATLEAAHRTSTLPEAATAREALNDLLLRLRLGT